MWFSGSLSVCRGFNAKCFPAKHMGCTYAGRQLRDKFFADTVPDKSFKHGLPGGRQVLQFQTPLSRLKQGSYTLCGGRRNIISLSRQVFNLCLLFLIAKDGILLVNCGGPGYGKALRTHRSMKFSFHHIYRSLVVLMLLLCSGFSLSAQTRLRKSTEASRAPVTQNRGIDASGNIKAARSMTPRGGNTVADTSGKDSLNLDTVKVKSATGLNSEIRYTANDSIKFSVDGKTIFLYGGGRIYYEELELDADYIRIDQTTKTLFAAGRYDRRMVYRGRPIFKQGADKPVTTDSILFNFETKKGKAYGTATSDDQGYIQARQFKKNEYNEGFLKDGIYSTCSLPEPYTHFGIHIDKGIVTEKQVMAKSAYLEIEHIPIYLAYLPFGFFPKTNKRASGFRFPTFGEDANQGFFMQGIGWYFGINDYWDADITGTLYSKGSFNVSTVARYRKNYKHNGNLNFSFARIKDPRGIEGTDLNSARKEFNVQWSHTQDQAANPGVTFSASVNFGTSTYNQATNAGGSYNYDRLVQNNMASSIAYGRTFFDGLFNFTTTLSSNQAITSLPNRADTLNRSRSSDANLNLTLPNYTLSMMTINPFDSKDRVGEQKWYQRITVGYNMTGSNTYNGREETLFKGNPLDKFTSNISQSIPVSLSLNVLKVLQFNTNINYNENWTFQTLRKYYDPTKAGRIGIDTVKGFARNFNYSMGGGFSTKIFGRVNFKKGNLMALRHVMTPQVSFSYSPDFTSERFGFYRQLGNLPTNAALLDTIRSANNGLLYSRFFSGVGGTKSASIGFSLDNTIEAKLRSKSDTGAASRNVPILQGFRLSGSYNLAAETMKLSDIAFSGRTALFNQKMGINFSGTLSPYQLGNENGTIKPINSYMIEKGSLARLTNFTISTDFSFNSAALKARNDALRAKQNDPNISPAQAEDIRSILMNPNYFVDFNVPWNLSASYSFSYSNPLGTSSINNTLNFNGDLSVTPKWKVQFNSGYDFKNKEISLTRFSINRDLHCWDMAIGWTPFGAYKSFSFDIRVRASILQDLKLSRRSALPLNYY